MYLLKIRFLRKSKYIKKVQTHVQQKVRKCLKKIFKGQNTNKFL